jgi:hypothetical protein
MAQFLEANAARTYAGLKRNRLTSGFEDAIDTRFDELNSVEQILFGLTLPSEMGGGVLRYNGTTSGLPTSAKTLVQDVKLNWQNVTVNGVLPAEEQMVFLFRNVLRAFVYYDANPGALNFDYIVTNWDGGTAYNAIGVVGGGYTPPSFNFAVPTALSLYQPHGDHFFPCYEQGRLGFWVDNTSAGGGTNAYASLGITFAADPGAAGANITWYLWDGVNWAAAVSEDTAAGTLVYYPSVGPVGGAYVSFEIKVNTAAAALYSVHIKSFNGPGVFCHRSIPNISELLPIINGVRVNAASVLWTNFSAELQASGKLVSVGVASALPWSNLVVSQSNLTKLQGYESRQAKTGGYSFLKPDGPVDFTFTADIRTVPFRGAITTVASFPINERSSYVVLALSVANIDARDTSIQICHAIEYLTNSKIQEVSYSPFTENDWTDAIQRCRRVPQHYENKIHFGKIFRKIARIGKTVFNVAKTVAPLLSMIPNPIAQGIGRGIGIADQMGAGRLLDMAAE